ncbi:MAG: PAS domain-containing protein [Desulforhopalus sp.]|nr:PAS domain-containing protein [Desulforhopalus sp.]
MQIKRVSVLLVAVILIGISVFAHTLIRDEERFRTQDILKKGNYLVSLIALHPIEYFYGDKNNLFLKTLAEQVASEGLVYCFIHDRTGQPLVSFVNHNVASQIPPDVLMRSLYVEGLTQQTFRLTGSNTTINEFTKPVYQNGEKSGIVRLGFNVAPVSLFSAKRLRLLAMMAFFILATVLLLHYGITLAMRPLNEVNANFKRIYMDSSSVSTGLRKDAGIADVIVDLEQSLVQLKQKYEKIEAENTNLTTKCGVISFEKTNILNILDSMNYGVIVTDIQDNINYINAYMLNILNKTREEMVDRPLNESFDYNEINSFILNQDGVTQNNGPSSIDIEFPDLAPNETFMASVSFLRDREESVIGKVICVKNVTKEKSTERQQHEFIASITHELLTPLTTIKSYNEMLLDNELENIELQKEFYNTISEETNRLTSLVKNLLSISKIEMGSLTIEKGLIKGDWLFNDCMAAVEGTALKKKISIERKLPDNFPSLVGDKELLKAAIINILGNAVKYTPENGHIKFMLTEQDDFIIFEVTDDGHGISKEDLPHIFDKFYRSTDPHVTEQTGSGLGLALTSEIVRLHGGEIEVNSKPDEGSHFMIRLPKEEYYLGKQ